MKRIMRFLKNLRHSLGFKLTLIFGSTLLLSIATWTYFLIRHAKTIPNLEKDLERGMIVPAVLILLATLIVVSISVMRLINLPIRKLIIGTHRMARGNYDTPVEISQNDEIGHLAAAINRMGGEIGQKQAELNRQRNEYQNLFEQVPCLITVQNRDYRLIGFNREFSEHFNPRLGDYCYHAYKGRNQKCESCPVEKTFLEGKSHYAEETGVNKDGSAAYWVVKTSAIRNEKGDVVAAMEMSLDVTHRRKLEEKLQSSEKKYQEIFNKIPNPAFVLDQTTLEILDCNQSVLSVYGFTRDEMIGRSFLDIFEPHDGKSFASGGNKAALLHKVRHLTRHGEVIYVDIRVSPSDYSGSKVFLVTTSDITQQLEAERQLIQASKMATLGEMATGIAHELNQPLSVMKTASGFILRKLEQQAAIEEDILATMLKKIDGNVDRASRIIQHMRQFARKSDFDRQPVDVNEALERAYEIFREQLKLRGIRVVNRTGQNLPKAAADPSRLEQVFINLLVNARDAIEEKWEGKTAGEDQRRITLVTRAEKKYIVVEVHDTGPGVSDAIADKIFEPFFTTKAAGKGTGLGLYISYGIVKECGGAIRVLPSTEGGACFLVELPLWDSNSGSDPDPMMREHSDGKENTTGR
jgi:histidine kinase